MCSTEQAQSPLKYSLQAGFAMRDSSPFVVKQCLLVFFVCDNERVLDHKYSYRKKKKGILITTTGAAVDGGAGCMQAYPLRSYPARNVMDLEACRVLHRALPTHTVAPSVAKVTARLCLHCCFVGLFGMSLLPRLDSQTVDEAKILIAIRLCFF